MAGNEKSKLSKTVLMMKFMSRSALQKDLEEDETEQQIPIDEDHWVLDLPELKQKESRFITDASYVHCEDLLFGRMSFKGFNPEIEKLMRDKNDEEELMRAEERERELGVDDEEMVKRYSSLMDTIGKKFKKKRQKEVQSDEDAKDDDLSQPPKKMKKNKKKRSFIKPEDS